MICDAELTLEELDSAVMCLSLDKSPGPDGITSSFYFWRVCLGVYIYLASCLSISNRAINTIKQINFKFIWRKCVHYIKRAQFIQDYENGGLQAFDLSCINGMLKVKWLKKLYCKLK